MQVAKRAQERAAGSTTPLSAIIDRGATTWTGVTQRSHSQGAAGTATIAPGSSGALQPAARVEAIEIALAKRQS
jgi:hypothetical protein